MVAGSTEAAVVKGSSTAVVVGSSSAVVKEFSTVTTDSDVLTSVCVVAGSARVEFVVITV